MDGFNTYEKQDRVLVGMSGGVDSSVTVRILQEQGFAVQGAVIRFSPAHDAAVAAARDAARSLGVEVHVIDAAEAFDREVVTPFCRSYCEGRTPNPCILCNPAVKFRLAGRKGRRTGRSLIWPPATMPASSGATTVSAACTPPRASPGTRATCSTGWGGTFWNRLVLPLGEFEKSDVRDIAREH